MAYQTTLKYEAAWLLYKGHEIEEAGYLKPGDPMVTLRFAPHPDVDTHLQEFDGNPIAPLQDYIRQVERVWRMIRQAQEERSVRQRSGGGRR